MNSNKKTGGKKKQKRIWKYLLKKNVDFLYNTFVQLNLTVTLIQSNHKWYHMSNQISTAWMLSQPFDKKDSNLSLQ